MFGARASSDFGASDSEKEQTQQRADDNCVLDQRSARALREGWFGRVSQRPGALGYRLRFFIDEQRFSRSVGHLFAKQILGFDLGTIVNFETHVVGLLTGDRIQEIVDTIRTIN